MTKKLVLDAETRKKLLGLLPITSDFIHRYTPELYNEVEEEFRPIYLLRPWKSNELKALAHIVADNEDMAMEYLSKQIVGWENVLNIQTGETIDFEFEDGHISKEQMNLIPSKVIIDLLSEVTKISGA